MSDKKLENYYVLQRNFDNMIKSRMKGESTLSSLNYSPNYQNDNLSRLILHGNNSITSQPLKYDIPYKQKEPNRYFPNVQHQYLNYQKMWNLPQDNIENFNDYKELPAGNESYQNNTKEGTSYSKYSLETK